MNFNLISVTLAIFSVSSIFPYSSSQDVNAFTQQYGGLISKGLGAVQEAAKNNGGEGNSNIKSLLQSAKSVQAKCVAKLMPCKEYFRNSMTDVVSQSCCEPLRVVISEDMGCLCGVVKIEGLLKTINFTLDNAFNVAKTCGAEPDYSACDDYAPSPAPIAMEFETLTTSITPSSEPSLTKSPDSPLTTSTPAPTPSSTHAADESEGHMEKSSMIVMLLTLMLLAI